MKHVQDRIQAYLDGELTAAAAAAVRDHCQSCAECHRVLRETRDLWEAVTAEPAPRLEQSIWPTLARRLPDHRPEQSSGRPHEEGRWGWRYSFAGLGVTAAAAGLVLGLWLGQTPPGAADETEWYSLLAEGVLLVEGGDWTLDQAYLAAGAEEEEDQP